MKATPMPITTTHQVILLAVPILLIYRKFATDDDNLLLEDITEFRKDERFFTPL